MLAALKKLRHTFMEENLARPLFARFPSPSHPGLFSLRSVAVSCVTENNAPNDHFRDKVDVRCLHCECCRATNASANLMCVEAHHASARGF